MFPLRMANKGLSAHGIEINRAERVDINRIFVALFFKRAEQVRVEDGPH